MANLKRQLGAPQKECLSCKAPLANARRVCRDCGQDQRAMKQDNILKATEAKPGFHANLRRQLHEKTLKLFAKSGQRAQILIIDYQPDKGKVKGCVEGES
jgi:hypothetical protein